MLVARSASPYPPASNTLSRLTTASDRPGTPLARIIVVTAAATPLGGTPVVIASPAVIFAPRVWAVSASAGVVSRGGGEMGQAVLIQFGTNRERASSMGPSTSQSVTHQEMSAPAPRWGSGSMWTQPSSSVSPRSNRPYR